mmetsp:Transcript_113016/g.326583  ORF Transcript_113016/g.326583 Transcript_113016/m.326583 type:complete len:260 (-) Transcript_113016:394-1173(-)
MRPPLEQVVHGVRLALAHRRHRQPHARRRACDRGAAYRRVGPGGGLRRREGRHHLHADADLANRAAVLGGRRGGNRRLLPPGVACGRKPPEDGGGARVRSKARPPRPQGMEEGAAQASAWAHEAQEALRRQEGQADHSPSRGPSGVRQRAGGPHQPGSRADAHAPGRARCGEDVARAGARVAVSSHRGSVEHGSGAVPRRRNIGGFAEARQGVECERGPQDRPLRHRRRRREPHHGCPARALRRLRGLGVRHVARGEGD